MWSSKDGFTPNQEGEFAKPVDMFISGGRPPHLSVALFPSTGGRVVSVAFPNSNYPKQTVDLEASAYRWNGWEKRGFSSRKIAIIPSRGESLASLH